MALPKAVQRQRDAAKKYLEDLNAEAGGEDGDQAADEGGEGEGASAQSASPGEYEPKPIELPDPTPPASSAPEPAEPNGESWRDRYAALSEEHQRLLARHSTLQGKYNAEVGADVRRLREENESLRARLDQIMRQPAAPAPQKESGGEGEIDASIEQIRKRLANDLGDEQLVSDIEKLIGSLVGNRRSEMSPEQLEEIKSLRSELQQARHETRTALLSSLVPNWQTIDKDPRFLRFVQQIDPRTGETYQKLMNRAFADGDVRRTAFFFQEFERQIEANSSGKHHQASSIPAPDQTPDSENRASNKPREWPLSEIQKVTSAGFAKAWRGDPNELQQLQREARMALADGRYDASR